MVDAEKHGAAGAASDDMERAKARLAEEKEAAERLAHEARGAAGGIGSRARAAMERQGEEVQEEAANHLRSFADAVRRAGDELADREPGVTSDVIREAAHGLERFADTLSRRRPSEFVSAARDFGRRHPGAMLAGGVLAGFALARVATAGGSHAEHGEADVEHDPYGGAYAAAEPPSYGGGPGPYGSGGTTPRGGGL